MNRALTKWTPAAALILTALGLSQTLPPWAAMWLIAFALYFGAKWVTACAWFGRTTNARMFAYLLLWPGMDAVKFFNPAPVARPLRNETTAPIVKILCGCALLGIASHLQDQPTLRGWTAMIGLILILHFGLFHLLSIYWRNRGVNALPIMAKPMGSTSLTELWGVRWNAAFTTLMQRTFMRPLARCVGTNGAFLGIFLISGGIHELVITVPARGGYGWPTAYFALQGLGALFERTVAGRALGLGHGAIGWLFVFLIAGAPAYFLFPRAFIHNVILPMIQHL